MTEPVLTDDDRRIWEIWMRAACEHTRTQSYARKLDIARSVASNELEKASSPIIMWSGGKDSTAMTHLIRVGLGADVPAISEKDDLDYPGEREYVEHFATAWSLRLTILTPAVSPRAYLAEHAHELRAWDDVHSRRSGLSAAVFYGEIERAGAEHDTIFLGLRKYESCHRMMNRNVNGLAYTKQNGKRVTQPLGDWCGLDVMAYMQSHDIDPLPVYRCIAFMHAQELWRVRKSWWLPGASGAHGGVAWLRRYYPSLYAQLRAWMPSAESLR